MGGGEEGIARISRDGRERSRCRLALDNLRLPCGPLRE